MNPLFEAIDAKVDRAKAELLEAGELRFKNAKAELLHDVMVDLMRDAAIAVLSRLAIEHEDRADDYRAAVKGIS